MVQSKIQVIKHLDREWLEDMLIYAMRYTLGRGSYSPGVSTDFIRPLIPFLTTKTLSVMERDIRQSVSDSLPYRVEIWVPFLTKLQAELSARGFIGYD